MNLKCIDTVTTSFDIILFTKDKVYEFIPVDNRYTRVTMKHLNFVGYVKKDDEGFKRWMGKEFKEQYFIEV